MPTAADGDARDVDVVVVGAGFAGLYALHKLRGLGWRVHGFEAGRGVGGTWYWNRYPGARCDVESIEYSYSFDEELEQEWEWTERYAGQPEILRYLEHVADRFELRPLISFDTRVESIVFDDDATRWTVVTSDGATTTARFVVMATGCLSSANVPAIEGLDQFAGPVFHTGQWPHEGVDFTGQRVGIIGTGSSGIQTIPVIAAEADHLVVFQRTPNYSVPARNRPLDPDEQRTVKANYRTFRAASRERPTGFGSHFKPAEPSALAVDEATRVEEYEGRWERGGFEFLGAYADLVIDRVANDTAAEFVRKKIAATVHDPAVAAMLTPSQVIGCKRLCLDTNYFETFNRPNVTLVDLNRTPIETVTESGIRTSTETFELDCIVCATGFDAMTGSLLRIDIRGRAGATLADAWHAGPRTYLGLGVPGFPNLFIITGPGSPSVLTNMVVSIEQHVEWIADCLEHLRANGHTRIEATDDATEQWVAYVNAVADLTLFPTCNSWYLGANIPGKTRVFMPLPGFPPYAEMCASVAADGYRGFAIDS